MSRNWYAHSDPIAAIDIIWYSSWVNYMTRVADAFQLPLDAKMYSHRQKLRKNPKKRSRKSKSRAQEEPVMLRPFVTVPYVRR